VFDDVVAWATEDPNVRLMVLTGSFARGDHDALSDLDIELYARDPSLLLEETAWYERFGDVLVTEALENPDWHPTRLVYYVDGKIDFMVAPLTTLSEGVVYDGPFLVALDKDGRADRLEPKVGTSPPSADEFRTCIEWFYAAALQYAKAVVRDDPWPMKMRDVGLKEELLHMLEWDFGVRNGWAEHPPHNGRNIASWTSPDLADRISACWSDFSVPASVDALLNSIALFSIVRQRVAAALHFPDGLGERASTEVERLLAMRTTPRPNA
jgi:aminoglycoside 6-adenylyltransferase